jgi:hypothetical protein
MPPESWFIRIRGRIAGPYTLVELQKMARRGSISRIHEISYDRVNWVPASSIKELFQDEAPEPQLPPQDAQVGGVGTAPSDTTLEPDGTIPLIALEPGGAAAPPAGVEAIRPPLSEVAGAEFPVRVGPILRHAGNLSLAGGLCAAGLLIFCLNVPHDRIEGRLVWWWSLLGRPGAAVMVVCCFFTVLLSASLLVATPLTRGQARGWVFIGLGGFGLMLFAVAGISVAPTAAPFLLAVIAPALGAALTSASLFRLLEPEERLGATVQAIAGGLLAFAALAAGVMSVWGMLLLPRSDGSVPTWAIVAIMLSVVACLCGIVGGILGLAGARTAFSRSMNTAIIVLSLVVTAIPAIAAVITGYGVANLLAAASPSGRFVLVQVVRLTVASYSLIALAAIGLSELLIAGSFGPVEGAANEEAFSWESP